MYMSAHANIKVHSLMYDDKTRYTYWLIVNSERSWMFESFAFISDRSIMWPGFCNSIKLRTETFHRRFIKFDNRHLRLCNTYSHETRSIDRSIPLLCPGTNCSRLIWQVSRSWDFQHARPRAARSSRVYREPYISAERTAATVMDGLGVRCDSANSRLPSRVCRSPRSNGNFSPLRRRRREGSKSPPFDAT